MGVHQYHGTLYILLLPIEQHDLTLRLDSKNLPEQTYNDTVAIAIGRKFDLSLYLLVRFLTRSWDRKPGGVTQRNPHAQCGTQLVHGYRPLRCPHALGDSVGLASDHYS